MFNGKKEKPLLINSYEFTQIVISMGCANEDDMLNENNHIF